MNLFKNRLLLSLHCIALFHKVFPANWRLTLLHITAIADFYLHLASVHLNSLAPPWEPGLTLCYPFSTSRNQVLVQSQCFYRFGVGSTGEPFKNRFAFPQAREPPQSKVLGHWIHLMYISPTAPRCIPIKPKHTPSTMVDVALLPFQIWRSKDYVHLVGQGNPAPSPWRKRFLCCVHATS